jgi:hypothetical protein
MSTPEGVTQGIPVMQQARLADPRNVGIVTGYRDLARSNDFAGRLSNYDQSIAAQQGQLSRAVKPSDVRRYTENIANIRRRRERQIKADANSMLASKSFEGINPQSGFGVMVRRFDQDGNVIVGADGQPVFDLITQTSSPTQLAEGLNLQVIQDKGVKDAGLTLLQLPSPPQDVKANIRAFIARNEPGALERVYQKSRSNDPVEREDAQRTLDKLLTSAEIIEAPDGSISTMAVNDRWNRLNTNEALAAALLRPKKEGSGLFTRADLMLSRQQQDQRFADGIQTLTPDVAAQYQYVEPLESVTEAYSRNIGSGDIAYRPDARLDATTGIFPDIEGQNDYRESLRAYGMQPVDRIVSITPIEVKRAADLFDPIYTERLKITKNLPEEERTYLRDINNQDVYEELAEQLYTSGYAETPQEAYRVMDVMREYRNAVPWENRVEPGLEYDGKKLVKVYPTAGEYAAAMRPYYPAGFNPPSRGLDTTGFAEQQRNLERIGFEVFSGQQEIGTDPDSIAFRVSSEQDFNRQRPELTESGYEQTINYDSGLPAEFASPARLSLPASLNPANRPAPLSPAQADLVSSLPAIRQGIKTAELEGNLPEAARLRRMRDEAIALEASTAGYDRTEPVDVDPAFIGLQMHRGGFNYVPDAAAGYAAIRGMDSGFIPGHLSASGQPEARMAVRTAPPAGNIDPDSPAYLMGYGEYDQRRLAENRAMPSESVREVYPLADDRTLGFNRLILGSSPGENDYPIRRQVGAINPFQVQNLTPSGYTGQSLLFSRNMETPVGRYNPRNYMANPEFGMVDGTLAREMSVVPTMPRGDGYIAPINFLRQATDAHNPAIERLRTRIAEAEQAGEMTRVENLENLLGGEVQELEKKLDYALRAMGTNPEQIGNASDINRIVASRAIVDRMGGQANVEARIQQLGQLLQDPSLPVTQRGFLERELDQLSQVGFYSDADVQSAYRRRDELNRIPVTPSTIPARDDAALREAYNAAFEARKRQAAADFVIGDVLRDRGTIRDAIIREGADPLDAQAIMRLDPSEAALPEISELTLADRQRQDAIDTAIRAERMMPERDALLAEYSRTEAALGRIQAALENPALPGDLNSLATLQATESRLNERLEEIGEVLKDGQLGQINVTPYRQLAEELELTGETGIDRDASLTDEAITRSALGQGKFFVRPEDDRTILPEELPTRDSMRDLRLDGATNQTVRLIDEIYKLSSLTDYDVAETISNELSLDNRHPFTGDLEGMLNRAYLTGDPAQLLRLKETIERSRAYRDTMNTIRNRVQDSAVNQSRAALTQQGSVLESQAQQQRIANEAKIIALANSLKMNPAVVRRLVNSGQIQLDNPGNVSYQPPSGVDPIAGQLSQPPAMYRTAPQLDYFSEGVPVYRPAF